MQNGILVEQCWICIGNCCCNFFAKDSMNLKASCRGSCILASHCAEIGNFDDVAKELLVKIDQQAKSSSSPSPSMMTYKEL
jgi:hypothetical protein